MFVGYRKVFLQLVLFTVSLYTLWRIFIIPKPMPPFTSSTSVEGVNSTLGFQKIFVVNLPSRTDRRDMFELMAVFNGIDVEFVKAVKGEEVEDVAFVQGMGRNISTGGPGYIGSWRSHLNVVQTIVHERLSTALIFEDDIDWDIRLKPQMEPMLKALHSAEFTQGWDLLWLGHQGDQLPPDDHRHLVIQDSTVPENLSQGFRKAMDQFPMHTRILHPSDYPLATFAYVLSAAGAQKVLYYLGLKEIKSYSGAYDEMLANYCRTFMNCITLTPGLFHDFKAAGSGAKQSLNNPHWEKERSEELYSKNIDKSVREHLKLSFNKPVRTRRPRLTENQLYDRFNEVFTDERFGVPDEG